MTRGNVTRTGSKKSWAKRGLARKPARLSPSAVAATARLTLEQTTFRNSRIGNVLNDARPHCRGVTAWSKMVETDGAATAGCAPSLHRSGPVGYRWSCAQCRPSGHGSMPHRAATTILKVSERRDILQGYGVRLRFGETGSNVKINHVQSNPSAIAMPPVVGNCE
jgi:hypothetical protein